MIASTNNYPAITQDMLDAIAMSMDDEIREAVSSDLAGCAPGEFLAEYLRRDPEFPIHQFRTA